MKVLLFAVVAIFAVVNGFTSGEDEGKIVGGFNPTNLIYYQAALLYNGQQIGCGGSIIGANWILTAGHCVPGLRPNNILVRVGSHFYNSGGQLLRVQQIISHPQYRHGQSFDYDVALLKLASAIQFTNGVNAIRLPSAGQLPSTGATAWVSGWGHQQFNGVSPVQVRMVDVRITDWNTCRSSYPTLTDRMICAYLPGKDSCQNDSGGPLVIGQVQVGVVSWGDECAKPNKPGVYARVSEPNIRRFISQNSGI